MDGSSVNEKTVYFGAGCGLRLVLIGFFYFVSNVWVCDLFFVGQAAYLNIRCVLDKLEALTPVSYLASDFGYKFARITFSYHYFL